VRTAVAAVRAALKAVCAHPLRLLDSFFGVCQAGIVLYGRNVDLGQAAGNEPPVRQVLLLIGSGSPADYGSRRQKVA